MPVDSLKDITVVYVEDDEIVLAQVGRAIGRRVRQVHLARNGREGLELVQEHHPQLVVTDLEMPVMGGMEMIRLIRRDRDRCDIPIVVVTAYRDEDHHTPEANEYVFKPIRLDDLVTRMTRALRDCGIIAG